MGGGSGHTHMTEIPSRPRSCRGRPFLSLIVAVLAAVLVACQRQPSPAAMTGESSSPARAASSTCTETVHADSPVAPEPLSPTQQPEPSRTPTLTNTATGTATATDIPTATVTPTPTATLSALERSDNILLMGIDRRPDDPTPGWRTDTIMVVALDDTSEQVGLVSIPRDLYVDIPGLGPGRINRVDYYGTEAGYPGGGPALLQRVLTETLSIPTHHYVRIEMEGLVRLVDALGGVTVTLTCPLYERTPDETSPNGLRDWMLPAGQVWLDGEAAKKFATYRYVTSDFGRVARQQQLIWALRERIMQVQMIPRIPELWSALADTFVTDLDVLSVLKLAQRGATLRPEQVHGMTLSNAALEPQITEEGAWVLAITDSDALILELGQVFMTRPLVDVGGSAPEECLPPPTEVPTFTPTPTGTATSTAG